MGVGDRQRQAAVRVAVVEIIHPLAERGARHQIKGIFFLDFESLDTRRVVMDLFLIWGRLRADYALPPVMKTITS